MGVPPNQGVVEMQFDGACPGVPLTSLGVIGKVHRFGTGGKIVVTSYQPRVYRHSSKSVQQFGVTGRN